MFFLDWLPITLHQCRHELSVAFSMKEDETASLTNIAAAAPHYLESWGDAQIKKGSFSLTQPTIRPLFNTRQFKTVCLYGQQTMQHITITSNRLGLECWQELPGIRH